MINSQFVNKSCQLLKIKVFYACHPKNYQLYVGTWWYYYLLILFVSIFNCSKV